MDGMDPYDPIKVKEKHMNFLALCRDMVEDTTKGKVVRESAAISTVVNGCLIKWCVPGKVMNIGSIEYWAKKNLAGWDQSIVRRARQRN